MKTLNLTLCCIVSILLLSSCMPNDTYLVPTPKDNKVAIPKGTALISFIDHKGVSHSMLPNGKKLKSCELCPQGKHKECAKNKSGKYCKTLVNATVFSVSSTIRIHSDVNPICWTEIEGGKARQTCVCLPDDPHELCN